MASDKSYAHGAELKEDTNPFDATTSPKYHKKESKGYVAFHSDSNESSDGEKCEDEFRSPKERKKIKKDRSNTFKDKFKSVKVKKKEKEVKKKEKEIKEKTKEKDKEIKEKNKDKDRDKEKEEKKEKEKKKKHKRSYSSGAVLVHTQPPTPPAEPVFGVPLEVAVARSKLPDGIELPRVVRECIQYIEEKGLDQEGIFRVSGIKSKIDEIKMLYDQGKKVDFEADDIEPNLIAGLFKLYLRELPTNILTPKLLPVFDSLIGLKDEQEKIDKYKQLLAELPVPNRTLLGWLFTLLGHIMERSRETKMNIQNVSIVFSPTMNISHGVLFVFMTHIAELFPDVQLVKYVEPEKPAAAVETSDIAESISSLEEELRQQDKFLDHLHEKINRGKEGENEEALEEMWEVQRRVTQVKRKLKALKRAKAKEDRERLERETLESAEQRDLQPSGENDKEPEQELKEKPQEQQNQDQTDSIEVQPPRQEIQMPIEKPEGTKVDADQQQTEEEAQKEQEKQVQQVERQEQQQEQKVHRRHPKQQPRKPERRSIPALTKSEKEELENEKPVDAVNKEEVAASSEPQKNVEMVKEKAEEEEYSAEEDDEELQELLKEEMRLKIEQEELLAVSEYLKDRVLREKHDIERLQQEIDSLRKRKDYSSPVSSSEEESSSESDSESGSESDEDDSELENILKELEKENERLENQTVDLVKSLVEERDKCVHLRTEIRILELDKERRGK